MANSAEDIDNKNIEFNNNVEMEVISEGTLNKEVVVPDEEIVTKQSWKKIYEVIDEDYFEHKDVMFPKQFILKCKKINEPQFIPVELKNIFNKLVLSKFFFQDFNIKRTFIEELKYSSKDKPRFKFERKSERSKTWFLLEQYWVEINFIARQKQFYNRMIQLHIPVQGDSTNITFPVPIVSEKKP